MTDGDHTKRFRWPFRKWDRWDKIVAVGLTVVLAAVTTEIVVEQREEAAEKKAELAQERREEARDREIRECVINVVEGIRIYLNERGEIATRDRESINRVIRVVAQARRTGDTSTADFDAALKHFEKTQRQVAKDRDNSELSDFPTGDCIDDIPPLKEPEAVPPSEAPKEQNDGTSADDPISAPRVDPARQKAKRKAPPPGPDTPRQRPRPEGPTARPNPPVIDLPEIPDIEVPDVELPDLDLPGILSVEAEPGEGIEVELLPKGEPACE